MLTSQTCLKQCQQMPMIHTWGGACNPDLQMSVLDPVCQEQEEQRRDNNHRQRTSQPTPSLGGFQPTNNARTFKNTQALNIHKKHRCRQPHTQPPSPVSPGWLAAARHAQYILIHQTSVRSGKQMLHPIKHPCISPVHTVLLPTAAANHKATRLVVIFQRCFRLKPHTPCAISCRQTRLLQRRRQTHQSAADRTGTAAAPWPCSTAGMRTVGTGCASTCSR